MQTLLVTGGAGFIGSAVVRLALARGYRVVTLDALTYAGSPESLAELAGDPAHEFVHGDIGDRELVRSVLARIRPRAVIHLAAESHVDRSIDAPADFIRTNLVGTWALLEEALAWWRALPAPERDAFRFVHVSTDEVFGSLGDTGRFDESSAYRPSSPYSASKAGSDHLARAWHATYGLPTVVTNCTNNYGPRQYPEKLIPLAIARALAGESIPVYGAGANVRDWLYVEDHAEALLAVAERGVAGETYCIGGDAERTNLALVRVLSALLDELRPDAAGPHERLITFVADRPGHDHRYAMEAGKIARELGWRPRHTLEAGLRDTVAWYLANGAWVEGVLRRTGYRGERLGIAGATAAQGSHEAGGATRQGGAPGATAHASAVTPAAEGAR